MENLNAEAVKKALECCTLGDCYPCPYGNIGTGCRDKMSEDALALITSQEQRIKELTEENERLTKRILIADEDIKRLRNKVTATIILTDKDAERIKTECLEKIELDVKAIKADTVQEFAERLKALLKTDYINGTREHALSVIDQIAKEMLEGEKSQ
jgi:7-keto-8-aminopelargonate synthetase-like enzyme